MAPSRAIHTHETGFVEEGVGIHALCTSCVAGAVHAAHRTSHAAPAGTKVVHAHAFGTLHGLVGRH